jgi:predicted nucleic acid-binding Zn ribbon protein
VLAAIAYNLTRAAAALAGPAHAKATGATLRAHLVTVPVRLARTGRRKTPSSPDRRNLLASTAHLVGVTG